MIEKLCKQIVNRPGFQSDYANLSRDNSLFLLNQKVEINWNGLYRLLKSATTFSLSVEESFRKLAYSIAIMARNVLQTADEGRRKELEGIIVIILSRLGNFPAENKYILETSFDKSVLPPLLQLERNYHMWKNQINPTLDKLLVLTDFQKELWNAMQHHKVVIVNAPTSAGKSFVLQNYVINSVIANRVKRILYIVPSRALIEQVIIDLRELIQSLKIPAEIIHVTEVPKDYSDIDRSIIYVLTQERAQLLLAANAAINLTIVDEAQNIADGARGVILQTVIEKIVECNDNAQFIFAMPFVKNPEVFLSIFNLGDDFQIIPSAESPVRQNLFNIIVNTQDSHNVKVEHIMESGNREYLCDIPIEYELVDEGRYLAILSVFFGRDHNNIVYGAEPSKCEKIASAIVQLLEKKEDPELIDFSKDLKRHIHKDFLLAETILYGVAYHYGVLPTFVRREIERLASAGKINYIVCTSTLLQGINLPAQNIFLLKPTKGRAGSDASSLDPAEFWNLVGRAGRLTKDYEGNIFLINLHEWKTQYISISERQQEVFASYNQMVIQNENQLLAYISDLNHPSGAASTQGYENVFMKLLDSYMAGGDEALTESLRNVGKVKDVSSVHSSIVQACTRINLPGKVLALNPNVSAYRQQEMEDYLVERIKEKGPLYLIPPHPMNRWEVVQGSYIQLFNRFARYFMKVPRPAAMKHDAILALLWMRGRSYSELLRDQISYKQKSLKRGEPKVNTEARNLFKKIDNDLRFEYVKFTKCYNDLLIHALSTIDVTGAIPAIPPLHLYLELGASSGTMVSLIGLGVSRNSAAQLTQAAVKTDMSEEETEEWLRGLNLKALDMPDTVISEVKQVIG